MSLGPASSDSYWLATAPGFTGATPGPVAGEVDVAVIGGGFTGLSAAVALRRRGASVAVLEAGRVIGEASGRNGGHCNTGVAQDYAALHASLGAEKARAFYQAYADAVASVEAVIAEEGIACDFHKAGKLKLAAKPQHYDNLAHTCELIRQEVDPDVELLSAAQVRVEVASDDFHGGLLQYNGAQMHMGRFGVGLADAAVRRGAQVYEGAAVSDLQRLPDGSFRVISAKGELRARQVLVATGNASVGPFQWFRRRIASVGSFIIATAPLPKAQLDELLPNRRTYVTSRIIGNYFRTTPDHRLIFGGRARFALSDPRQDAKSGAVLRAALGQLFPSLARTPIDYCWGGLVDMTADRLPRAGEQDGLFYAMGYSGHGVQMSVHMGRVMAEVLEGRSQANPWRVLDWPAIPGHFGKPWFLPLVGLYYRVQDRLH